MPRGNADSSNSYMSVSETLDTPRNVAKSSARRLIVHDLSGHPFQVQLSRELARRGHQVLHLHCPSFETGKGRLDADVNDPKSLTIRGLSLGRRFDKYSLRHRPKDEYDYGRLLSNEVARFAPEIVLSSNAPLISQWVLQRKCREMGSAFFFWQQDIYSVGMARGVGKHATFAAGAIRRSFTHLERQLLRKSEAVICISDGFIATLERWGIPPHKRHVIENWAPIDELPTRTKDNPWACAHGLADKQVVLYSGTLGLKHDPTLLVELAERLQGHTDAVVVVVSEGPGADWLRSERRRRGLTNLLLIGFQPYEHLPDVLGAADVLLVILDAAAGEFSVPSKVLTYHCAGRPLVAALPLHNLASHVIRDARSGYVVRPGDAAAAFRAVAGLLEDPEARAILGRKARDYAVATFDISSIADRFEFTLGISADAQRVH